MKKNLFFLLLLACITWTGTSKAQCGDRYRQAVFQGYTLTPQVPYGMNTNVEGLPQPLFMDIYEPLLDTLDKRPLLITAFGGSFAYGDKKSPDLLLMIDSFTKMGYVCASFDYRLLYETLPPNQFMAIKAVIRAVQDGKAAIRYLKANADMYGIDTTRIAMIGVSAGGFIALHNQFLDRPEELNGYITPEQLDSMGGLEGTSGTPGYSSKVNAIVNLCGALGKASWMDNNIVPVYSMHGTADGTVPYGHDTISLFGSVITVVDGSYAIDTFAKNHGLTNHQLYTWYGAGHTPFVPLYPAIGDPDWRKYMDTVMENVTPFLYKNLIGCDIASSVENRKADIADLQLYPNPASNNLNLSGIVLNGTEQLQVLDSKGAIALKQTWNGNSIDISSLKPGMYLVRLSDAKGSIRQQKLIVE